MKTVNIDLNDNESSGRKQQNYKSNSRKSSLMIYPKSHDQHEGDTGDVRFSMISSKTNNENNIIQTNMTKIGSSSTQNVKPIQQKTFGLKGKSIGMMEHSVFNNLKTQNLYTYRQNNPQLHTTSKKTAA